MKKYRQEKREQITTAKIQRRKQGKHKECRITHQEHVAQKQRKRKKNKC